MRNLLCLALLAAGPVQAATPVDPLTAADRMARAAVKEGRRDAVLAQLYQKVDEAQAAIDGLEDLMFQHALHMEETLSGLTALLSMRARPGEVPSEAELLRLGKVHHADAPVRAKLGPDAYFNRVWLGRVGPKHLLGLKTVYDEAKETLEELGKGQKLKAHRVSRELPVLERRLKDAQKRLEDYLDRNCPHLVR